ncbi:MAG: hypothetical protein V4534_06610 [Myxococcota bacterium]
MPREMESPIDPRLPSEDMDKVVIGRSANALGLNLAESVAAAVPQKLKSQVANFRPSSAHFAYSTQLEKGNQIEVMSLTELDKTRGEEGKDAFQADRFVSCLNAMLQGDPLPPVRIDFDENGKPWLADGFHRVYAAACLGFGSVPVEFSATKAEAAAQIRRTADEQYQKSQADRLSLASASPVQKWVPKSARLQR